MDKKKFYMTTAIAYTSGKPHIGNTYEFVLADAIARYKRSQGYDVFFQTGTDEHGQKIELKAAEAGVTCKEFVDNVAGEIKNLAEQSNGSAKEIKEIIENIIAISERSTASAGAIKEAVFKEENVLKDMHIDFEKVVKSINDVSGEIDEIASKMNEINTSKEAIMESTESLSAISEENAASTEETTATITEMTAQISAIDEQMRDVKKIVGKLNDVVGVFIV